MKLEDKQLKSSNRDYIIMQFLLLLFSKHATVWCTWRELLRIKNVDAVYRHKCYTYQKNIKIPNEVTEIIYCHCKAAASIMRAKVLSVVIHTHHHLDISAADRAAGAH